MRPIAICTDSSALFPAGVAEELDVTVVPISIALDGEPFDEHDERLDDFYARVSGGAEVTTSQPSPGEFLEAYEALAMRGANKIISIHLDSRTSGTVRSAELAAREAPIPVAVLDTRTVSFGVGLCVRAAAEALAHGASAAAAIDASGAVGDTLGNVFVAYAGPGGRVPNAPEWSVLEFDNGRIRPPDAPAGLEEAIDAMAGRVFAEDGQLCAAVGHAGKATEPAADALTLALESQAHVVAVERYRVGAAVGAHTGALSFGAFWWNASNGLGPRPGTASDTLDSKT
jgi:DegV family protein with EDD domain